MSRNEVPAKSDDRDILLRRAVCEIRETRRVNNILSAQMFVVETFRAALLGPPRGEGASPDLCWEIDRLLDGKDNEP